MESLYTSPGYIIHDPKTQFTLNVSGFFTTLPTNIQQLVKENYSFAIQVAKQKISDIEEGKIVNKTVIKHETENRAVDHYNLRLENSPVQGKSLKDSINYWNEIKEKITPLLNGEKKNPLNGKAYKSIIFNGIGGSYLGPLLLVVAMKGLYFNDLQRKEGLPELYFVSNTDAESFSQLFDKNGGALDLSQCLLVNMSKSGGTAETKGNMNTFNRLLLEQNVCKDNEIGNFNIAITTKGSNFDKFAQKNNFLHTFYMNEETGGRTSIVSAIGMVPCAFAKLNFDEFLRGQAHMDELTRKLNTVEEQLNNPALITAILMDHLQKYQGRKNLIVLGYSDALREFAHYLQQLYMESLGKQFHETFGVEQPEGQTVFGGVGTGEQHAFMQQVQKGLNDCIVKFVHFLKRRVDYSVMDPTNKDELAGETSEDKSYLSMGRQMLGFVKGTENALYKNGKPFMTCTYLECNLFNIGMMIALEERIVTILAAFRGINAYDQPGVQDGKLSANDMNKYGDLLERKLCAQLRQQKSWKGDATKARNELLGDNAPLWYVDSILSDIYGNWEVEKAYPRLKQLLHKVDRSFVDSSKFEYQFYSNL
ncbi:hypothetical protein ABK040_002435 [Willaertia magna]